MPGSFAARGGGRFPPLRRGIAGVWLAVALAALGTSGLRAQPNARRPFADSLSRHHPERSRSYDLEHVLLKLTLDERRRSVAGTSTLTLRPLNPGLESVEVDSAELRIKFVSLPDGTRLPFEEGPESLRIRLPRAAGPTDSITLSIAYEATPRKGLFFITPDRAYPDKPVQIWSQGQVEDSHFWFPVYDYPNDKTTSEGIYTVNSDYTVISNGRLLGIEANSAAGTKTYHWKQEIPHSTYLISVVAGKFEKYSEAVGETAVEYYVPPGTGREKALRSLGETPNALRFFSERIGFPYPYPKYSQVAVEDFTFLGMENISATTLTDRALHEAVSEPQANSVDLVTHELAHQWFGDLLTCADWAHGWLNEGFATFWAAVYREHLFGKEEYSYSLHREKSQYLEEDRQRYRRPMVTSFYTEPYDLFDRTLYEKGALVLDMLRFVLGDDRFFRAFAHYTRKHQQGTVATEDFQKAVEEATGEKLDWFFDQWAYKAGYPELEVSQQWDEAHRRLGLVVEQKQTVADSTPLFRMPVEVEFTTAAGKTTHRIEFSRAREEFSFTLDSRPRMTRFDPDHRILKTLKFQKPAAELIYQLEADPAVLGRVWASEQLAEIGNDPQVVPALRRRLIEDPFWGVREAAAAALGKLKTDSAREALAEGLKDRDARVRQASVRALGAFTKDKKAAQLAETLYRSDPNHPVSAEAALAIGKIKAKGAKKLLEKAIERESDQDLVRRQSLTGFAELGDKKGREIAARWVVYGRPSLTRRAAVEALGKLGRGHQRTIEQLIALLDDPDLFVRLSAIRALADGNFQMARPALARSAQLEVHDFTRRAAQRALERLGSAPAAKPTPARAQAERPTAAPAHTNRLRPVLVGPDFSP